MHLPSGTRMCLLLAFAFLLITTEYPEFSRVKGPGVISGRGAKDPNSISSNLVSEESGALEAYDEPEGGEMGSDLQPETTNIGYRSTILVEAWGYRRWGGGYGGYGGGWGYRRR